MRNGLRLLAALVMSVAPVAAQSTAFVGVTVIPMDRERTLANQTVVVTNGRITAMGPAASTTVPSGATRIDGAGKFLMPGLAEMHAHVPPQTTNDQLLRDIMFLYLANGVTTIRGMLGAPYQLQLREQLAQLKQTEDKEEEKHHAAPEDAGKTDSPP